MKKILEIISAPNHAIEDYLLLQLLKLKKDKPTISAEEFKRNGMELIYAKSFPKELKRLPLQVQTSVKEALEKLESADNLLSSGLDISRIENQKKTENYYRI